MWRTGCYQLSLSWLLLVSAGALNVQRAQKFIGLLKIQAALGCICPEVSRGNSHFNEKSTPIKLMWTVTRWHFQKGIKAIVGITCQKLLSIKELACLVPLQLVGSVTAERQGPIPVDPALAKSLSVEAIRCHPKNYSSFQVAQQFFYVLPLAIILWIREDNLVQAADLVALAVGYPTAFRTGSCHLLHQYFTII